MGKVLNDTKVEFVRRGGSHLAVEGEKNRMLDERMCGDTMLYNCEERIDNKMNSNPWHAEF